MSIDVILKDHEGNEYSFENIRMLNWFEGQVTGIENIVGRLRKQSGEAFAETDDTKAKILRGLAADLEKDVLEKAKRELYHYKQDNPEIIKHVTGEGL